MYPVNNDLSSGDVWLLRAREVESTGMASTFCTKHKTDAINSEESETAIAYKRRSLGWSTITWPSSLVIRNSTGRSGRGPQLQRPSSSSSAVARN